MRPGFHCRRTFHFELWRGDDAETTLCNNVEGEQEAAKAAIGGRRACGSLFVFH